MTDGPAGDGLCAAISRRRHSKCPRVSRLQATARSQQLALRRLATSGKWCSRCTRGFASCGPRRSWSRSGEGAFWSTGVNPRFTGMPLLVAPQMARGARTAGGVGVGECGELHGDRSRDAGWHWRSIAPIPLDHRGTARSTSNWAKTWLGPQFSRAREGAAVAEKDRRPLLITELRN